MTGLVLHQCPKCELRFSFRSELEHHLREDHPQPAEVEPTPAVKDAETPVAVPLPKAPPVMPTPETRRRPAWSRARLAAFLLAFAGVLLVTYAAVFVSTSTAVVLAALALALSWVHVRRSRGRARLPRPEKSPQRSVRRRP